MIPADGMISLMTLLTAGCNPLRYMYIFGYTWALSCFERSSVANEPTRSKGLLINCGLTIEWWAWGYPLVN